MDLGRSRHRHRRTSGPSLGQCLLLSWAVPFAGLATAAPLRPVPDYAPTQAVILSSELFAASYHAGELVEAITASGAAVWLASPEAKSRRSLKTLLKAGGVSTATARQVRSVALPHSNLWLRDYGPLVSAAAPETAAVSASGSFPVQLHFFDLVYADPAGSDNDRVPAALGQLLGVATTPVALELDGGNFLTNGDFCFTSREDLPISKRGPLERALAELGCQKTVVITAAPHAHLDMWAKIVNDHQVLVNELDDKSLAVAAKTYGFVPPELAQLRDALNAGAKEWSRYLEVRRVPMPLPYRGAFRTYTNALLVNGHAVVPSYHRFGWNYDSYPDSELEASYNAAARAAYEALQFSVSTVNADALAYNGGVFRCVTAQIPGLPPPRTKALRQAQHLPRGPSGSAVH